MRDQQAAAREFIARDLDDALGLIADVRKLMQHANLSTEVADDLTGRLDRAEGALETARKELPDA